ncbi:ParB/RepB/Spo0J family partition protein [Azospirillum melinis]|uniref:ParB/RepB/Spo0J family partition protein n=1 Tax=Azospirillum melinis TaxID=328839 RepID=A0ABX2KFN0_9PROT|nr:ParB/RepB/Spo0J family partition protein [Azospirillum melinis]MBP2307509.1 ParB family chromosome partitioning protein [Azospirillum melinis]NUB01954.1 ParB/RepB/Spo0J family partition protein [Azospirillum melinis]
MSGPVKPRAAFAAASFTALRAALGEGQGEVLHLPLADIDEDPGQPRTLFEEEELALLAASIRAHGVVQPVVVRPAVDGRYRLAFGARRLRAARLAGLADIPAVIRRAGDGDFAGQVIENQHRAPLSNSDLATAIRRLAADGHTGKQIATICALKGYEVSAFRQAVNFPPELRARMDHADMRALYDLYRQWRKTPDAVLDALPAADVVLTITDARRIVGAITGRPTGSLVPDRPMPASAAPDPVHDGTSVPAASLPHGDLFHGTNPTMPEGYGRKKDESKLKAAPGPTAVGTVQQPVFLVTAGDGAEGRLIVDRRAGGAGLVLVAYASGVAEVKAADLRIVRVE